MLSGISGFISGVIVLYFQTELINTSPYSINMALFLTAVGILLASPFSASGSLILPPKAQARFANWHLVRGVLFYATALILGFTYAYHHCHALKSAILPAQYDNQTLLMEGFVCGLPRQSEFSNAAEFCITSLSTETGERLPGEGFKAVLRWPLDLELPMQPSVMSVLSRQPRATVNFSGFSYEANLFYKGVILIGKVQQIKQIQGSDALSRLQQIRHHYHQLRIRLAAFCDLLLKQTGHRGILRALILGDRSQLSVEDHKLLSMTGTQHLIAISGLHVGIVMLAFYFILPNNLFSTVLLAVFGGVYVLLVGFGPSAQRAWIMCLFGLLYAAGYIRRGKWLIYMLALFLVLLIDPLAPLNAGFWFSFLCVAILLLATDFTPDTLSPWWMFVLVQIVFMLAMAPLYGELGLPNGVANILANLIAVPWISLLILPLVLGTFILACLVFGLSQAFDAMITSVFQCLDFLVEWLMVYLNSLSLFMNDWLLIPIASLQVGYILCLLSFLLMFRFKSMRLCILPALLLVISLPSRLGTHMDELLVFDAGQGLAIAMSFGSQTWIYDSGPAYGRLSTVDQAILPYLRAQRLLKRTRGLIISHGDADHAGDVSSLIRVLKQPSLVSGEPERVSEEYAFGICEAGMFWQEGGSRIEVLYPFSEDSGQISEDSGQISGDSGQISGDSGQSRVGTDLLTKTNPVSNNRSCVIRFTLHGKTFLLMGDLEGDAELELVRHYRHALKADVLIAGHHGAPKGTSYALLKHVLPDYVVFSAGFLNAFGHPADQVRERVSNMNSVSERLKKGLSISMLNTANMGALRFQVEEQGEQFVLGMAREEKSDFWLRNSNL